MLMSLTFLHGYNASTEARPESSQQVQGRFGMNVIRH